MKNLNELQRNGSAMLEEEWCGVCPKCQAIKQGIPVEYDFWSVAWGIFKTSWFLVIIFPLFLLAPLLGAAVISGRTIGYVCRSCGHFTRLSERKSTL